MSLRVVQFISKRGTGIVNRLCCRTSLALKFSTAPNIRPPAIGVGRRPFSTSSFDSAQHQTQQPHHQRSNQTQQNNEPPKFGKKRTNTSKKSLRRAAAVDAAAAASVSTPSITQGGLSSPSSSQALETRLQTKTCTSYCTADKYDLALAVKVLRNKGYIPDPFNTGLLDQVLHLRVSLGSPSATTIPPSPPVFVSGPGQGLQGEKGDIFVFPSGNIVSWGVPEEQISRLARELEEAAEGRYREEDVETEDLEFVEDYTGSIGKRSWVRGDVIWIGMGSGATASGIGGGSGSGEQQYQEGRSWESKQRDEAKEKEKDKDDSDGGGGSKENNASKQQQELIDKAGKGEGSGSNTNIKAEKVTSLATTTLMTMPALPPVPFFPLSQQQQSLPSATTTHPNQDPSESLPIILAKVAFSSGLARSTKLAHLESLLQNYLDTTSSIPQLLSSGARLPLTFTRRFILRKTGELLHFRAQLNLYSELTDSLPDLFWDQRHELGLEGYYEAVGRALDVEIRIKRLNEKMDYASEIVKVLREHLGEKHGLVLEWMIILLIAVEVGFEVLRLLKEGREVKVHEVANKEGRMGKGGADADSDDVARATRYYTSQQLPSLELGDVRQGEEELKAAQYVQQQRGVKKGSAFWGKGG